MEKLKKQSFPSVSTHDWKVKAEQSLKGKTVESLQTTTYENIILKPLYTQEDETNVPDYPGGSDFRRGIFPLGYVTNDWEIAQRLSCQTAEELKEKLYHSFEKGQTAISFSVSKDWLDINLVKGLVDSYSHYPFAINAKDSQAAFLALLEKTLEQVGTGDKFRGYIGSDPVAIFATEGNISEEFFKVWINQIRSSTEMFPNLRTILIDTAPYHNGGASAVQELGVAIAEGVFYLEQFQQARLELYEIFAKMIFQFSIGSNFFMEIAKLRSARILWDRISSIYGANNHMSKLNI
ncbi:MAG: methylmalonyl-CoA mutase family protein, partial [Bacillus sp. (in: firmicutes)]